MKDLLKNKLAIGSAIAIIVLGIAGGAAIKKSNEETDKAAKELRAYKNSMPNYADSTRIFNEKHRAEMNKLQAKSDSMYTVIDSLDRYLDVEKEMAAAREERQTYLKPLAYMNGRLNEFSAKEIETQQLLQAHLDSVRANAGFWVRKSALKYSK